MIHVLVDRGRSLRNAAEEMPEADTGRTFCSKVVLCLEGRIKSAKFREKLRIWLNKDRKGDI